jgi:hypothetical protein
MLHPSNAPGYPYFRALKRAFSELRANWRAVSETYVRITFDHPWNHPGSKRRTAGCRD